MKAQLLSLESVDMLVDFEKKARISEPDIFIWDFDEHTFKADTIKSLENPLFASARCMICVENGEVLGRLDFALLPSIGGDLRAYVDWVYVLKEHRHKGIAQFLFKEMGEYLAKLGVAEYILLTAENDEAQRFYKNMQGAEIVKQEVLTKTL